MAESLYSLEVYVDQLRLHDSVQCVFPSVILKLLDFQPILISHLPSDFLAELRSTSRPEVLSRAKEFKGDDGSFIIRRGKSVLFRFEPKLLTEHLGKVPLYLLISDELPHPRKLIGVVTLSIHELALKILEWIATHGVTTPSCQETTGVFKVLSLMGHAIGLVGIKIRLVMAGPSLLHHIPDGSLLPHAATGAGDSPTVEEQERKTQEPSTVTVTADAAVNQSQAVQACQVADLADVQLKSNAAIQTQKRSQQRISRGPIAHVLVSPPSSPDPEETLESEDYLENLFKAEVIAEPVGTQPPPLFYNSVLSDPQSARRRDNIIRFVHEEEEEEEEEESWPANFPKEELKFKCLQRLVAKRKAEAAEGGDRPRRPSSKRVSSAERRDAGGMPLLNALLEELVTWKSMESLGSVRSEERQQRPLSVRTPTTITTTTTKKAPGRLPKRTRSSEALAAKPEKRKGDSEKRSDFLRRLSIPREAPAPPGGIVPKSTGWLRSAPHFKGGAALSYGTTHTHRMRMALRPQKPEKQTSAERPSSTRALKLRAPAAAKAATEAPSPSPSLERQPAPRRHRLSRSSNFSGEDSLPPEPEVSASPAPAPRLGRQRSEEASQDLRAATAESGSQFFTSVDETELVPLKESSSSSTSSSASTSSASSSSEASEVKGSPRGEKTAAESNGPHLNPIPIQSSRSPFLSGGRASSVPMPSYEASASTAKPQLTQRSSEVADDRDTYTADFSEGGPTRTDLNPYDTSEWQTSGETPPYSPHKPPIPTRSFESPSPRRRRTSRGSQSPGTRPRRRARSSSHSFTSSSIEEGPEDVGGESRNFYASSVMSSGTKVTPMTRGSTTKGSVFIPPLSGAHTDSVSSYMPTDPDNMSMMSGESFSEDFQ